MGKVLDKALWLSVALVLCMRSATAQGIAWDAVSVTGSVSGPDGDYTAEIKGDPVAAIHVSCGMIAPKVDFWVKGVPQSYSFGPPVQKDIFGLREENTILARHFCRSGEAVLPAEVQREKLFLKVYRVFEPVLPPPP